MDNIERGGMLPVIGISQGDPNGVGLELIIKSFAEPFIYKYCTPVLYASQKSFIFYKKALEMEEPMYNSIKDASEAKAGKFNLVMCNENGPEPLPGEATAEAGKEALVCLDAAIADIKAGHLHGLVTAPLDKGTVAMNMPGFSGHTGYLAKHLGAVNYAMFLICDEMRVALATEHVPVAQISANLSTEGLYNKIKVIYNSLVKDFALVRPRIAVLGLNPHAGDHGLIGKEDKEVITPAIEKAFKENILVYGPYPADSFFGSGQAGTFDAVVAIYHDQGLIPFKTVAFYDGVNYTAGLDIVRTSPDHGTAYSLAGKGEAVALSFQNAIFSAIEIVRNRQQHAEDKENPLPYTELRREKFRIDF